MAGIDKTYINGSEYLTYRNWWIDNYDKMIEEFGYAIYLYTFCVIKTYLYITPEILKNTNDDLDIFKRKKKFPIWNTTEKEDLWLIKNCKIESYQKTLIENYPKNWRGFYDSITS